MDIFCLVWINLVSLALLFIVLWMWPILRLQFPKPLLFDLIAYFAVLKIILIFLIPALLRGVNDWRLDRAIGADPFEIAINYTIELASYSIWLLTIWLVTQLPGIKKIFNYKNDPYNAAAIAAEEENLDLDERDFKGHVGQKQATDDGQAKLFMMLLCGLYLFYILSKEFPLLESVYHFRPVALLSVFFKWAVMLTGPVVAVYIFSIRKKWIGSLTFFAGVITAVISMTQALASGLRATVVGMAMWLFFLYVFVSRKKTPLIAAMIMILLMAFLHETILEVRAKAGFSDKSSFKRIEAFMVYEKTGDFWDDLMKGLEFRFGEASRVSVAFLRLYDSGMAAGLKTIKSALYAPLPRRFFPWKPQPGSVDGTREGMGMYTVQSYMRAFPWNMSDFLTGGHAYWELGLFGVAVFSFMSGVFVTFCAKFFANFGLVGLPLMMMVLKPWWNEPKLWISQIILESVTVLIPLVVMWYFIGFIQNLLRGCKRHLAIIFEPNGLREAED